MPATQDLQPVLVTVNELLVKRGKWKKMVKFLFSFHPLLSPTINNSQ